MNASLCLRDSLAHFAIILLPPEGGGIKKIPTSSPERMVRTVTTSNHKVFCIYGSVLVAISKISFIIVLT